jgi:uncharacterized delta-60 repeat protein
MMKTRAVRVLLAVVVGVAAWCVVGVGAAVGAPGDLDTTFGTGGKVTTPIGNGNDYGYAVAVDSQGRVVVAGASYNGSDNDFAVARYTSAGVLDTSFGTGGKVTTAIGNNTDWGSAMAVDSQDRIVVAGHSSNGSLSELAVVRYTSAGVLDTSFGGGDGIVTTTLVVLAGAPGAGSFLGNAVAVDSDDRVVIAGHGYLDNSGNADFAVARYTSAGVVDTSFGGGDGIVTTAVGAGTDRGYGVVVDSADRIVVAGESSNGSDRDFAVARYTSAGVLDATFGGGDGIVVTDFGNSDDNGRGVVVDSQGRVVVAGESWNGSDDDFAVARYTSAGVLDTSFSTDGKLTTAIGSSNDIGRSVAVDSDDRVVVAGSSYGVTPVGDYDFAVVRYTSTGVLDASFSTDGMVTTAIGSGSDLGQAVAVDSAGRIIVAGSSYNGSDDDFAVVRFLAASAPGAPSGVTGVAGDGQVFVSWVAPASSGGAVITDYVVEYSSDGGSSWSTFVDGTSTSTSATVGGLSNGVSYVFRVSAVNAAGTGTGFGPVSVGSPVVTPAPAGCTITGTPGDDVLYGTNGADHICGLGGNDKIYGKGGNDILDGGPGNDVLKGGKGKDKLYGRGGADVLKGGPGNDKLYGNGGRDKLHGEAGNDRLVGGSNRDTLYGGKGKDKLYGGKARDLLVGGPKKDKLYGGKGKDKTKKPGPDVLVSIEIVVP